MVTFTSGDIFGSAAQVITNTVNGVGVMGAGLALEFKRRYPAMFEDYRSRCAAGQVKPGEPYLWEDDRTQILNFPTKRHWQNPSRLDDVEAGIKYLAANYQRLGIQSLAMPPLGCGLGGLRWSDVRALVEKHLGALPDLEVFVYEPAEAATNPLDGEKPAAASSRGDRGVAAGPQKSIL